MKFFRYRRPILENPSRHHQGQRRSKGTRHHRGDEAVPVVDEYETEDQAGCWLRVGYRATDTKWLAETGRMPGGGHRGSGGDYGCDRLCRNYSITRRHFDGPERFLST